MYEKFNCLLSTRAVRLVEQVALMEEIRHAYAVLVETSSVKTQLDRPGNRWENTIKMNRMKKV
jgi:hypothetical protein